MARFAATHASADPYRAFPFHIYWDGRCVAGIGKMRRIAGAGGQSPDPTADPVDAPAILLDHGVTLDSPFAAWAIRGAESGSAGPHDALRATIRIDALSLTGEIAHSYRVAGAWVSVFQALPDLDASATACAIDHIRLENQGVERGGGYEP